MNYLKITLACLFLASTPLMLTSCDKNSDLEEASEEVSDEIDDATTN